MGLEILSYPSCIKLESQDINRKIPAQSSLTLLGLGILFSHYSRTCAGNPSSSVL